MDNICPNCGNQLRIMKGKYGQFWGCPQYQTCGFKGRKIETTPSEGLQKAVPGNEEVLEALRKLWVSIEDFKKEFREFVRIFGEK